MLWLTRPFEVFHESSSHSPVSEIADAWSHPPAWALCFFGAAPRHSSRSKIKEEEYILTLQEGFILIRCSTTEAASTSADPPPQPKPQTPNPKPPAFSPGFRRRSSASKRIERARLRFEVEDSGCGIPADKRELVFSDYSQADGPATSQAHGGTGLGLGIVRKLVGMMGGGVEIVDKASPGCLFRFDLVLETVPPMSFLSRSPSSNTPWLSPGWHKSMEGATVLICGVHRLTLGVNTRALRQRGAAVLEASSWEETLTALQSLGKDVRIGGGSSTQNTQRSPAGFPPEQASSPGITVYIPGDPSSRPLQKLTLDVADSPPAADSPTSFRNCLPSMLPSPRQSGHVAQRESEIQPAELSVKVAVLMLSLLPFGGESTLLRQDLEQLHEALGGEELAERAGTA
jgi:hypothetical protein